MESLGVGEMKALQALLDETFLPRRSCDRRGPLPQRLRLRAAQAARPAERWEEFETWRTLMLEQQPEGLPPLNPPVRTWRFGADQTEARCNECYLFHGTSWASAQRILDQGFDLDLCGLWPQFLQSAPLP
ncbi:unnamed protein product [Durusdinium trenchii]|uniref:PARP n=1 Tax=Durusdinium trenchii TaxID=1381693 RepID=A0ABP0P5H5_9DINO